MIRIALLLTVVAWISAYEDHDFQFHQFTRSYGKTYLTAEDFHYRKSIFRHNVHRINYHNKLYAAGNHTFSLRVNEFADMTTEEFVNVMNGYRQTERQTPKPVRRRTRRDLPDEVNWVDKGYVTAVKNQGQCGSCWSFSSTGSLEGQHFKATGKLVSLSEKNLMDCSSSYGNHGCQGGLMDNAFRYVIANKGIDTEDSYPYVAEVGQCRFNQSNVGSNCIGYTDVPSGDEDALKSATAEIGPISVAIDASHYTFQFYHTGVYDETACSSIQLDHGVLVVGYGMYEAKAYWLVKNSWGPGWGDSGYIRMSRNKNNQCGIATKASYPKVTV